MSRKRFGSGEIAALVMLLFAAVMVFLFFVAPRIAAAIDYWTTPWKW